MSALISDLKERGLLDDTLVIWGGEFGRTPVVRFALARNACGSGSSPRNSPVSEYRRVLEVSPAVDGTGRHSVTETVTFRIVATIEYCTHDQRCTKRYDGDSDETRATPDG